MLSLSAPNELWRSGEGGKVPDLVGAAYAAAGKPGAVRAVANLSAAVDLLVTP
jgi:hypothetical protein